MIKKCLPIAFLLSLSSPHYALAENDHWKTPSNYILLSSSSTQQCKNNALLREMKSVKTVDKSSIDKVWTLFAKVAKSLEVHMDENIISELGRLLSLVFKVDSNYYTVEIFSSVIDKYEQVFLRDLQKVLNQGDYELFIDGVKTMRHELLYGNG